MAVFSNEKQQHHRPSICGRDCELCTDDDDKIQVSVSPRRLDLPPPMDKKAKMHIVNKNPYPIYFKAGTSNMDVFKPQPDNGYIPPNSRVSVVVEFYDSARPPRRHEEVVITTSIRPFENYAFSGDNICPYCLESVEASKHRKKSKRVRSQEYVGRKERFIHNSNSQAKHHALDNSKTFQSQSINRRSSTPRKDTQQQRHFNNDIQAKHHVQDNGEMLFQSQPDGRRFPTPRKDMQTTEYVNHPFQNQDHSGSHFDNRSEFERKEQPTGRETFTIGQQEMEEICLHAFVHRPTGGGCECNNCYRLNIFPTHATATNGLQHVRHSKERNLTDTEIISETNLKRKRAEEMERTASKDYGRDEVSEKRAGKDKGRYEASEGSASKDKGRREVLDMKACEEKRKDEVSGKEVSKSVKDKKKEHEGDTAQRPNNGGKIPHIRARVVSSDEDKIPSSISDSFSTPELSHSTISGVRINAKIVSENDFMKKVEKARAKKLRKRLQEESQSTSTEETQSTSTEETSSGQEVGKAPVKTLPSKSWKELFSTIDQKVAMLLQLSWITLFISLFLVVTVFWFIVFCICPQRTVAANNYGGFYKTPCFYDFFK